MALNPYRGNNVLDINSVGARLAERLGRSGIAQVFRNRMARVRNRFYQGLASRSGRSTALRQKNARFMNNMMRRKRPHSGIGVTTQHDSRQIYQKRRMPRSRRRRWRSFVKRVDFVAEKQLGTRTVVLNTSFTASNSTAGNHAVGCVYLYPQKSTTSYASDLNQISALENAGDPTAAAGVTVDKASKYMFQSGILDVTFCNTSTWSGVTGGAAQRVPEAKLEVDVYECSVRESAEETGTTFQTFLEMLADNKTQTKPIGGAAAEIDYNIRGVTPWDMTYVLSRWGVRIWKKRKYELSNSDTFTYQIRDPRRHVVDERNIAAKDGFNRPGWTRVLYFVAKLVPPLVVGSVAVADRYQENLSVGVTRKYMYKIEGISEDRTAYISG